MRPARSRTASASCSTDFHQLDRSQDLYQHQVATLERLDERKELLSGFDRVRRDLDNSGQLSALDRFGQRALDILTSSSARDAFDLDKEPRALRERAISVVQPHGEVDSNQHRSVLRKTGILMIRAHPWLGLGPEQIKYQFDQWVPADARPLPVGYYGHLHNIYLQYAAERGVPALLIFLWLIANLQG